MSSWSSSSRRRVPIIPSQIALPRIVNYTRVVRQTILQRAD